MALEQLTKGATALSEMSHFFLKTWSKYGKRVQFDPGGHTLFKNFSIIIAAIIIYSYFSVWNIL